jgi:hypothetical protein
MIPLIDEPTGIHGLFICGVDNRWPGEPLMKTSLLLILASASLSLAAEKRIQMKDLPAAVQ